MIINADINPSRNIYYLGAILLQVIKNFPEENLDILDVFQKMNNKKEISMNLYILTLDWLFAIGAIDFYKGKIKKCF